jgi:6-phosphogluconolactonase
MYLSKERDVIMLDQMYISIAGEDRIALFTVDEDTGILTPRGDAEVSGRPAPLAVDPQRKYLYVGRRGERKISGYRIDPETGSLSLTGTVPLKSDPCYLATDRTDRFLFSSYYEAGGVAVHSLDDNGAPTTPPVVWLATGRGAHSIQTDPTNQFAFVPHISGSNGPNMILQFNFDADTGHLTPNAPPTVEPPSRVGPRHFCFHPSKPILYFSNEQGCSVTGYRMDPAEGTLSPFQTVPTLPRDFHGRNSCAQIQIAPSGKFLYAPNRGHNTIACFSIDSETGLLTSTGWTPTEPIPRAFNLDPRGHYIYAAGLESGRLASYRINQQSGQLQPLQKYALGKEPMWVLITQLRR